MNPVKSIYEKLQVTSYSGFPGGTSGKVLPANAGDMRDRGLLSGSGRFPGRGHGNPCPVLPNPPVFLPEESTVYKVTKS